jgi:GH24 family phage-related lysozyme (muramidase)
VSESRVWDAFEHDLGIAISECCILFGNEWEHYPGEVQEILVNMMFNMGRTRLSKFKNFRVMLDTHNWKQAAVEGRDSLWYKQVTNRAERLMTRLENV